MGTSDITSKNEYPGTGHLVRRKIISARPVGPRRMFDLEVAHPSHNFQLSNGVITSNSHAICYTVIAYACAFLKYHFELEWWCGLLRNADKKEIDTKFWRHCGHLIDNPDINASSEEFQIKDGRIRAPISLLMGIGPKAHEELCLGRPYQDITDYCQKIEQYKVNHPITMADGRIRKGNSQLNSKINSYLIIAGAMDSLFQNLKLPTLDKLLLFNEIQAKAVGKSKVEPLNPKYRDINSLQMFQTRRKILQAYAEDMRQLYINAGAPHIYVIDGKKRYLYKGEKIPFVGGREIEILSSPDNTDIGVIKVAAPAYIMGDELRPYGGNKQMQKIQVDIEGGRMEFVRWPPRGQNKIPEDAVRGAEGCLVVLILEKYKAEKPFAIKDVILVSENFE